MFYSRYSLIPCATLGAKAKAGGRDGALLLIEDDEGVGYADLHPWVELGDAPLERQLQTLKDGRPTPLAERSLTLARLDRGARRRGVSAFAGLAVPASHFLVTDLAALNTALLEALAADGFRHLKLKLGREPGAEARLLNDLLATPQGKSFYWRLDFNGVLTAEGFRAFTEEITPAVREAIEFVEDPTPWHWREWLRLQSTTELQFALDRFDSPPTGDELMRGARVLVVKPAAQDPAAMVHLAQMGGLRVVFTSYLDHPVGQVGAALEAARLVSAELGRWELGACGLVSHLAYEPNEFSERLSIKAARLVPPSGTGIGFDDLLAAREWKAL